MKKCFKLVLLTLVLMVGTMSASVKQTYAYTEAEKQMAKSWLSAHGYSPDMGGAQQAYADYQAGRIDINGNRVSQGTSDPEVVGGDSQTTLTSGSSEQNPGDSTSEESVGLSGEENRAAEGETDTSQADAVGADTQPGGEAADITPEADSVDKEAGIEADMDAASAQTAAEDAEEIPSPEILSEETADDGTEQADLSVQMVKKSGNSPVALAFWIVAVLAAGAFGLLIRNIIRDRKKNLSEQN